MQRHNPGFPFAVYKAAYHTQHLAAVEKVNYEYVFDLTEEGVEHGYLAGYGSTDISAVRRESDTLIVTSPMKKGVLWDMHKVVKRVEYEVENFQYELMNNALDDSFAARMVAHYGTVIKTNAELRRILAGYDAARHITLDSVQIISGETSGETYEVNGFMQDEVRDIAISKTLLLRFKAYRANLFISRDVMSFLVSQVQMIYPEFHCVGVLV